MSDLKSPFSDPALNALVIAFSENNKYLSDVDTKREEWKTYDLKFQKKSDDQKVHNAKLKDEYLDALAKADKQRLLHLGSEGVGAIFTNLVEALVPMIKGNENEKYRFTPDKIEAMKRTFANKEYSAIKGNGEQLKAAVKVVLGLGN